MGGPDEWGSGMVIGSYRGPGKQTTVCPLLNSALSCIRRDGQQPELCKRAALFLPSALRVAVSQGPSNPPNLPKSYHCFQTIPNGSHVTLSC